MISVITPMYNEESRIEESISVVTKQLEKLSEEWELIVVNDGSTDNSLEIVKKLSGNNKNIKVVSYSINRGRGKALRAGFEGARGDIIITIESDSSWGDDIILQMLDKLKENPDYDFVIASPHLADGGYKNVPFHRVFLSKFGNKLLAKAFFNKVTMSTGMTRCYKREVIKYLNLESDEKEIHLEILSKAIALGFLPVEVSARLEWKKGEKTKSKRKSSFKIKKLILSHLLFSFSELPWLLLGTLGYFFLSLGVAFGLIDFIDQQLFFYHSKNNKYIPLFNLNLIVLLIIVGIQILIFNFIANQNRQTQREIIRIQRDILKAKETEEKEKYSE